MRNSQSAFQVRRLGVAHNFQAYNPFNPLQSYLIQNQSDKEYVNSVANQRISYFLDRNMTKNDYVYRKMLRNQISTGVKSDEEFKKYFEKVAVTRDQSEQEVKDMRMDQVKTDKMVKSAKNLRPKNAIKHVKMTQEDFAVNNCAQITDPEELKKQIQQLVHVNKIKNFVQRVNNLKQIKYLNKALDEIKDTHAKKFKPIKYLLNDNKDPRALVKPLRMPITDFKVVKLKQKPLNLSDDLTIDFFNFNTAPHQIVVPKHTAEQEKIQKGEVITELGFKIRQTSEIAVVAHQKQLELENEQNLSSAQKDDRQFHQIHSRRIRNQARQQGLLHDNQSLEAIAKDQLERDVSINSPEQDNYDHNNMFVTSFNPNPIQKTPLNYELSLPVKSPSTSKHLVRSPETPSAFIPESGRQSQHQKVSIQITPTAIRDNIQQSQESHSPLRPYSRGGSQLQMSTSIGKFKGQVKMNQLMDQLNEYANNSSGSSKQIANQIGRFQNDYQKLSSQHFDKEQLQSHELEQLLRVEKTTSVVKDTKQFLR